MEHYDNALNLARTNNLKFETSVIVGNIGLIYQARGENDKALKYQKEALEIAKEIGNTPLIDKIKGLM